MAALAASGCSLLVVACGSSSPKPPSGSRSASGEASKPPNQIVADAATALRDAHGYVMQGTIIQNRQPVRLRVTVANQQSIDVAFSANGSDVEILTVASASFMRANRSFWTTHFGPRGGALANHWIQAQPSDAQSLTSSLGHFAPASLARCLAEDHGTLSVAGQRTVAGHPAVVIRDAGNAPGSSPGTLAVSTTGPPYPLEVTGTGPQRPGGHIDVCNDGKSSDTRGDLTFSQFGAVKPLSPPAKAIRPGSLGT